MQNRSLWLTHPKVKAAADKQIGKPEKKESSAYQRLKSAIAASGDWRNDSVQMDPEAGRLEWVFHGVDLIGTNTLLRCHQAKVKAYRELWKKRTSALIIQNQKLVREWCASASYPVRYESIYLTPHASQMDEDNLIGATKVVLDEVVRQTAIPDDSPEYIKHPLVESHRNKTGILLLVLMPIERELISPATKNWLDQAMTTK